MSYTALLNAVSGTAVAAKCSENTAYARRLYGSITNTLISVNGDTDYLSFREACDLLSVWMGISYDDACDLLYHVGGTLPIDNEVSYDLAAMGVQLSRA